MRYSMRQKFFSFGDNFSIKDENENDVYFVRGQVFSIGDKLAFEDISGNELAFIKQRIMSWSPTYEIYCGGQLSACIKKELFTLFKCRFEVESFSGSNIQVEGDFFDHEYSFSSNGRTIAKVSKEWFTWTDMYGIDIMNGEDDVLILACVVAIDMACHNEER